MEDLPLPGPREIHVWQRPLSLAAADREGLLALLNPAERERAGRFHFEKDRDAFIASHGWLRTLLGRYLGAHPRGIRFLFGERGKPAVEGDALQFNLSHSGGMAACAVTSDHAVGVDIERVRPLQDCEAIARRFFHPQECRKLLELDERERASAFFRCWTRKEAYIKALGDGLFAPLDSFEVTLAPAEPVRFVWIGGLPSPPQWSLFEFDAGPDHAGAVAIRGTGWAMLSRPG